MTGFEDTLAFMQLTYPTLFPNRYYAMDQLFFVLGNGYEWENGALVGGGIPPKDQWRKAMLRTRRDHWKFVLRMAQDHSRRIRQGVKDGLYKDSRDLKKLFKRDHRTDNYRDFRKHLRTEFRDARERRHTMPSWYRLAPPTETSPQGIGNMYEIPWDEIQNDWLDGLIEALQLVVADTRTQDDFRKQYAERGFIGAPPPHHKRYMKRVLRHSARMRKLWERRGADSERGFNDLQFNKEACKPILDKALAVKTARAS